MPDNQGATDAQAADDTTPQSQADQATSQAQGATADDQSTDPEIKRLRSEAASWRTKYQQTNTKLQQYENDQLSEKEQLKRERDTLQVERDDFRTRAILAERRVAATSAGAVYPDVVARMVADDVEGDDALKAAFIALKKQYPAMFRGGSADGGAGTVNGGGVSVDDDMNSRIRRGAGLVA